MANRNLADEVDALAKGLASLRVANKRTVSRLAALEDRELEWLMLKAGVAKEPKPSLPIIPQPRGFLENKERAARPSLWQRIRAWRWT